MDRDEKKESASVRRLPSPAPPPTVLLPEQQELQNLDASLASASISRNSVLAPEKAHQQGDLGESG